MFDKLLNKFSKIFSAIKGHGKISEKNISEAIREIRIALLESDVNFKVVSTFKVTSPVVPPPVKPDPATTEVTSPASCVCASTYAFMASEED